MKQDKLFQEDNVQVVEQLDLKSADNIAETIIHQLDAWCERIEVVGSIRRCKAVVHDIDFVVLPKRAGDWEKMRTQCLTMMDTKPIFKRGDQIIRALLKLAYEKYIQIDFYRCTSDNYGVQKLVRTGSAEHNVWLAKLAIKQNLRLLYSKGVCDGDTVIAGSGEKECFNALNLEFIPPQEREVESENKPVWNYKKYWRGE